MNKEDYLFYQKLNDEITIYRGLQDKNTKIKGLSWTISKEISKKFSKMIDEQGSIYEAKINKKDIFAYFNERNEQEIVVNTQKLKEIKKITA